MKKIFSSDDSILLDILQQCTGKRGRYSLPACFQVVMIIIGKMPVNSLNLNTWTHLKSRRNSGVSGLFPSGPKLSLCMTGRRQWIVLLSRVVMNKLKALQSRELSVWVYLSNSPFFAFGRNFCCFFLESNKENPASVQLCFLYFHIASK